MLATLYCTQCGKQLTYVHKPKKQLCRSCLCRYHAKTLGYKTWTNQDLIELQYTCELKKEIDHKRGEITFLKQQIKELQKKRRPVRKQLTKKYGLARLHNQQRARGYLNKTKTDPIKEMFGRLRVELTKTAGRLNQ
jgi:hypothetical protein